MKNKTLTILLLLTISVGLFCREKPKIEVYLVDRATYVDTKEKVNGLYFECLESDIPDSSFLSDNDIIGYEIKKDSLQQNKISSYYLRLSIVGQSKLKKLENIPLCCGQRFVITVDRKPLYGGYFWNSYSSFSCAWLTIPTLNSSRLEILRGLPCTYFTEKHNDPRGDKKLIEAFRITKRLIES